MKPKVSLYRFATSGSTAALISVFTLCVAGISAGAEYNWNTTTGNWNTATNWLVGAGPATGVPGAADNANVANGGTAQSTSTSPVTIATLRAGSGAGGTIQISGGSTFTTANVQVGRQNGSGTTGTLTISGTGTILNNSGETLIGYGTAAAGTLGTGATGVLNINSGAVFNHSNAGPDTFGIGDTRAVATNGGVFKGTLNVDGGTLNIPAGRLYIGQSSANGSSLGEVNLSNNGAINLNSSHVVIGRFGGTGILNISGGTLAKSGTGNFIVGDLAGGTSITTTGTVTQTAGTVAINDGGLLVGNGAGTSGTYNLGGTGTINKPAGGNSIIGAGGGNGKLFQTGGTIASTTPNGEFFVGDAGGSTGLYELSGGNLTVNNWIAVGRNGANGTLNVKGGSITKTGNGNFVIGTGGANNQGTLSVSAGLVNLSSELWVGEGSNALATISATGEVLSTAVQVAVSNTAFPGILKLNGGTLKTGRIFGGGGNATVEFNGTLVQATGNQAAFLDNIDTLDLKSGGALIDTNGFSVGSGANQIISGTGGLTKSGLGTLTLSGADTYSGPTLVSAGTLAFSSVSAISGGITVANGAALGINVKVLDQKISPSSLTLGASTINLDYTVASDPVNGSTPFPSNAAPVNVTGALTANGAAGTTLINLTGNFVVGQIPVIKYGSLGGTGGFSSFKLGTIPPGATAVLVNNTANKSIDINITRLNVPYWNGNQSSVWDINLTENWQLPNTDSTFYFDGDPAYFTDVSSAPSVTLNVTVKPLMVIFEGSTNYVISGTGKIDGAGGVVKRGMSNVTLGTTNTYTGITRIEEGLLSVASLPNGGVASPIGSSTAAPANLVLAGGSLNYTGGNATTNRGYTLAGNGGIQVSNAATNLTLNGTLATTSGSFTKTGPGTLTISSTGAQTIGVGNGIYRIQEGKVVLLGTGAATPQVITQTGEVYVGTAAGFGGNLQVTDSTLNMTSWFAIGRGTGTAGITSTASFTNSNLAAANFSTGFGNGIAGNLATQTVTFANSTVNIPGEWKIGESHGSTSTVTFTGNKTITMGSLQMALGGGIAPNLSSAVMTVGDSTVINAGTADIHQYVSLGRDAGTGHLILKDNAKFANFDDFTLGEANGSNGSGLLTVQNSAVFSTWSFLVGRGSTNTGLVTQTGGSITTGDLKDARIGQNGTGTWNLSAGTASIGGAATLGWAGEGTGTLNVSGGTFTLVRDDQAIIIGEDGTGSLNLSGTGTVISNGDYRIGLANTAKGTLTQTGGTNTVSKNVILGDGGTAAGTLALTAGTFTMRNIGAASNLVVGNNGSAQGTVTVGGSAVVALHNNAAIQLGKGTTNGANTFTQTGGTITSYSNAGTTVGGTGVVLIGSSTATGVNTMNLSGGTLTVPGITSLGSTSNLNLGGGTLKATAASTTFVSGLTSVTVEAGGAIIDSNSYNVTVVNALKDGGTGGGLTKQGAGTLTLSGANTYLGNTTVTTGTVTLADNAELKFYAGANGVNNRLTGAGSAVLNGDFRLDLSGANLTNGNSWTLVNVANKTYGASFSVVGFTEAANVWTMQAGTNKWTFSQVTGALTLEITSGGNAYNTWIGGFFPGVTDPAIIGATADPDGDGSSNALEFALGGTPNSGASGPKIYSFQADSSADEDTNKELLMTIAVRSGVTPAFSLTATPTATTTDGLTVYSVQGSLDLVNFASTVTPVTPAITTGLPDAPAGYEYRTFSLNASNGLGSKGFLRVKINP